MPQTAQSQVGDISLAAGPLERPADHRAIQVGEEGIGPHYTRPCTENHSHSVLIKITLRSLSLVRLRGIVRQQSATSSQHRLRISERRMPVCMRGPRWDGDTAACDRRPIGAWFPPASDGAAGLVVFQGGHTSCFGYLLAVCLAVRSGMIPMVRVPEIIPVSDLYLDAAALLRGTQVSPRPLVITRRGQAS